MTETPDGEPADLDGASVERAAAVVDDGGGAGETRETLAIVARDGVVRRAAVDDAVANASLVVTTAETRTEFAAGKLDGAREAAAPVADLAPVSGRLDDFDARLADVESRADDLGDAVQEVLDMKGDGDLYEIARRVKRVTTAATEVQRAADDLQFEIDSFEGWLADSDRRVEELDADVDALAASVDELDAAVESLDADGEAAGSERGAAARWAAATVRHRVASLLIADVRAELAALRTWAEREGDAPPSGIGPRLDEVRARHETAGERLAARAEPEWTARFGDRLAALDEALDSMEPPVPWAEVEAVVEEYRPAIDG
ncbi:halo transducer protein [Halorubrum sp. Hd13]|uniref:halo transducer protein n=1 Tax=Halorubrum sp. Hd13 TaxID=1480728 RepID=UPI000B981AD7|nr:halo transducer protein [Halorubrum sp. Hd13]OYR39627.1 halo transducer protein [Halorubrum sp. Hd13]